MTKNRRENTTALIVAAGEGRRLGGRPKALITLDDVPLVQHVVQAVTDVAGQIIVGVRPADLDQIQTLLGDTATVVAGGASRQETVQLLLARADREMVLIHDVARPFTSLALYAAVIDAAFAFGGAAPVLPASTSDSVAMADGDWLGDALSRDHVVRIQTPYAFARESLVHAFDLARAQNTEHTSVTTLVSNAGYRTRLIPGDPNNIKITFPEDLQNTHARLAGGT